LFKSGDKSTIERCQAIFDAITDRHFYLGEFGAATKMKLIANMMVCVHDLMAAEALNLGKSVGLDPAQMVQVLGPSAAGSATFSNKAPLMLSREFANGRGPFRHMFGYLERAQALARSALSPAATPLLDCTRKIFDVAQQQGRHDQDIAAMIEVIETLHSRGLSHV
jgi:L-threonate 2-dehydrogenase